MKKKFLILFLIVFSLIIRLITAGNFFHLDLLSNASWGQWIANNGPKNFYYQNQWVYSWPTQLPLINLVYGWSFDLYRYLIIYLLKFGFLLNHFGLSSGILNVYNSWVTSFNSPLAFDIPHQTALLFSLKIIPIIADYLIGLLIFYIAKFKNQKNPVYWTLGFLFSPFSFYLSSFWGQYDNVSFLFIILSFLTLRKFTFISPLLFSLSLGIKPTTAVFIPFYLYLLIINKLYLKTVIGIIMAIIVNFFVFQAFNPTANLLDHLSGRLYEQVVLKSEFRVTVNSFNFWHLFYGDRSINQNSLFLFLPHQIWSYLILFFINFSVFKLLRKNRLSLFSSLAIIGIGSWLFGMNMLERYLYAGIAFGFFSLFDNPSLKKVWVGLSLLFWLNLFKQWWQPNQLLFLRSILENYWWIGQIIIPSSIILLFVTFFYRSISPSVGHDSDTK